MKILFVLYSLSETPTFRIFSDYNEAEAMYHKADVPDSDMEPRGKYLLQVEDGEEFGISDTTPVGHCPDYPFFGATVLLKELSLEDE